jgi:peptidoglycan/xylan/chitin deacetylase (PgdA/CDA1 family)
MTQAAILTYHSHHVIGNDYGNNDHVALPLDLALIAALGHRIVPLQAIVSAVEDGKLGPGDDGDAMLVAITFDDGPIFDIDDFIHPQFGPQRGFVRIMQDFLATPAGSTQAELNATSFVIASPQARQIMETTFDPEYTYLGPGSMGDAWWDRAIDTGLISIATHSWDHLHPALPEVAHSTQARADFTQVLTPADADRQIRESFTYIAAHTSGRSLPFFAYPFGHYNDYLSNDYLPASRIDGRAMARAAFTAEPRKLSSGENLWRLPRYVCGHHWTSVEQLRRILDNGSA